MSRMISKYRKKELEQFIGLDFSMHELYVDSNGDCPKFAIHYRLSEKKFKREQRYKCCCEHTV